MKKALTAEDAEDAEENQSEEIIELEGGKIVRHLLPLIFASVAHMTIEVLNSGILSFPRVLCVLRGERFFGVRQ
jgi:hypothetical protein